MLGITRAEPLDAVQDANGVDDPGLAMLMVRGARAVRWFVSPAASTGGAASP